MPGARDGSAMQVIGPRGRFRSRGHLVDGRGEYGGPLVDLFGADGERGAKRMMLSWVSLVTTPRSASRRHNGLAGYPAGIDLDADEKTAHERLSIALSRARSVHRACVWG